MGPFDINKGEPCMAFTCMALTFIGPPVPCVTMNGIALVGSDPGPPVPLMQDERCRLATSRPLPRAPLPRGAPAVPLAGPSAPGPHPTGAPHPHSRGETGGRRVKPSFHAPDAPHTPCMAPCVPPPTAFRMCECTVLGVTEDPPSGLGRWWDPSPPNGQSKRRDFSTLSA